MNIEDIKSQIEKAINGIKLRVVRESLLIEDPAALTSVAAFLKNSPEFRFDYLSSVTGADYLEFLESVYHLYSIEKRAGTIVLRVRVPKSNPRVPSLVPVYRGAEFQEREAFDMYGIVYEKHPDLRRLFMWDNYKGFPMRKDYQQEDSETLEAEDIAWLDQRGIKVTDEMRKKAEDLQREGKRALAQKPGAPEPA